MISITEFWVRALVCRNAFCKYWTWEISHLGSTELETFAIQSSHYTNCPINDIHEMAGRYSDTIIMKWRTGFQFHGSAVNALQWRHMCVMIAEINGISIICLTALRKKISKPPQTIWRIHRNPLDFSCERQLIRKAFQCHEVIMWFSVRRWRVVWLQNNGGIRGDI